MTANQPDTNLQQRGRTDATHKRGNEQNLVKVDMLTTVVSLLCLAVVLGFVGNTAQDYWKQGQHARAVWWTGATALIAVIGIMATVLPMAYRADSEVDPTKAEDDPLREVRDLLKSQQSAELRPYLGVRQGHNGNWQADFHSDQVHK